MDFIYTFLCILLQVLQIAILARALLSFVPSLGPDNRLVIILSEITEPILAPMRQVVPRVGIIDITPLIAMILLGLLQNIVCRPGGSFF